MSTYYKLLLSAAAVGFAAICIGIGYWFATNPHGVNYKSTPGEVKVRVFGVAGS